MPPTEREAAPHPLGTPHASKPEPRRPSFALGSKPPGTVKIQADAFKTSILLQEVKTKSSSSTTTDDTFLAPNKTNSKQAISQEIKSTISF